MNLIGWRLLIHAWSKGRHDSGIGPGVVTMSDCLSPENTGIRYLQNEMRIKYVQLSRENKLLNIAGP